MKTPKRRTIDKVLALLLFSAILLLYPRSEAQAAFIHTDPDGVQYVYELSGSRVVITEVLVPTTITTVHVPDKIFGGPVVAIGASSKIKSASKGAFFGNDHVKHIELPDSVCEIYEWAFHGLSNLETLSVNGDGIVIQQMAFDGCDKLEVTFRGTGDIKYVSGYVFNAASANHLDYDVLASRAGNNSWIGYDETWGNEATWKALMESLTPFTLDAPTASDPTWTPAFDSLNASNGYINADQIMSNSYVGSDYNVWARKATRWVDDSQEEAEVRFDVAYNSMGGKTKNDIVFVLDASGSMFFGNNLITGSNYSRQFQVFDETRSMAKAILDLNKGESQVYNRVAVNTFSYYLRDTSNGVPGTNSGFFSDYTELLKWLDEKNYIFNGATGYSYGLEDAYRMLNNRTDKSRNSSVLFLSDGMPNTGSRGTFPNGSYGYGGNETSMLSSIGVPRYGILFADGSAAAAVQLIAGKGGSNDDVSMMYSAQSSTQLHEAFGDIMNKVVANIGLSLHDEAGNQFDLDSGMSNATTGTGTVSTAGQATDWDLSQAQPRHIYTLVLRQKVKRNGTNFDAFYDGRMETNLGNAVVTDGTNGNTILSVATPYIERASGSQTIRTHVTNGTATGTGGITASELTDTIPKTGTYVVNWSGNSGAVLETIEISTDGGATRTPLNTTIYANGYRIEDVRQDYDIYVNYKMPHPIPAQGWSYYATVENGSISPESETEIPVRETRIVSYYPDAGYELDSIIVDGTTLSDPYSYASAYAFYEENEHVVHEIHVVYREIPELPEGSDEETWEDYRN